MNDETFSEEKRKFVTKGKRLALVVGVNSSVESSFQATLKYAENDAYEMARVLESPACEFTLHPSLLLGKEATTLGIKKAILDLTKQRTDQDFLLFYFSGHAKPMLVQGDRQDIYLVTNDFDENYMGDPNLHLSMNWLWKHLYEETSVGRIILILDCCYAGNIASSGPDQYQIDFYKLIDSYFKDEDAKTPKDRSRFILAATGHDKVAYEQDDHGLLTKFLLKALRGEITSAYDEEGYLDAHALCTYLQSTLQKQPPYVSGEGGYRCLLAWYPPQSDTFRQEAAKTNRMLITEDEFFKRLGEITVRPHKQPFDHAFCKEASLDDLNMKEIADFFQKDRVRQQQEFFIDVTDQELLQRFGLLQESSPSYGALLCFGKNPSRWIAGASIRCIRWEGNDRYDALSEDQSFRGSLLEQFEASKDFLRRNLRLSRVISTEGSTENWEIPFVALREALANALIHREYNNQTNYVRVEVFDNRIEISSPGGLPEPLTIPQLGLEKQYPLRNSQITRIFYLYNYGEELGSGIPRMRRAMREAGLSLPEFSSSDAKTFSVVLYRPQPQQVAPPQTPTSRFPSLREAIDSKRGYQMISIILATMLITSLFLSVFSRLFPAPSPNAGNVIGSGVIAEPNNELIGISKGTHAFDTNRIDGNLKIQAADELKNGDKAGGMTLWDWATAEDPSDAEALIYLEDQRVLASNKPYITLIVGTVLTGNTSNISTGRDNLQGAYVAQKEYNERHKNADNMQLLLSIANAGGEAAYANMAAQQIVQAAKQDSSIVGVMGWPFSSYALNALSVLSQAHIPMVSPTANDDALTNLSHFFFRVTPSNTSQAIAGALYSERQLHAKRAVLFVDPNDEYSNNLATTFSRKFVSDGNQIVDTEAYTIGNQQTLPTSLQKALTFNPDLIYFAGLLNDLTVLLVDLPHSQSNVQIMGDDALYSPGNYPSSAQASFSRLHFTAFSSPDEWDVLGLGRQKPAFFSEYQSYFNRTSQSYVGLYSFAHLDNDIILSYDTMLALLQGCQNTWKAGKTINSDILQQGLTQINGNQAIQGISGQISFGPGGDPINKAIIVLEVDSQGHIKMSNNGIQGCFLVGKC